MREWLIALGILVVVAILLDGLRRMRNARRDSLQMSQTMQQGLNRDSDEFGNDFPSGPARVVSQRNTADEEPDMLDDDNDLPFADTARRSPIDFRQVAPMLMDVKEDRQQRIEPGFGDEAASLDDEPDNHYGDADVDDSVALVVPPARGVKNASQVFDTATTPLGAGESEIISKPRVYERPADQPPPRREAPVLKPSKPVIKAQQEKQQKQQQQETAKSEQKPQQLALDDVIIISVMARERSGFPGAALLEILLANELRYGHRNIFHRYMGEESESESLFSVVNIVKPGTFDLNNMDSFQTPGISLFLPLPSPGNAMEAFEQMLTTARAVAEQLNGELRDDQRSVMTGQTVEHCRQRIRDFEMHSRLRAR